MGQGRKGSRPKLTTPYYPDAGRDKAYFENPTGDMKLVADYTRMSFREVEETELFEYYGYLHDAVVWGCGRTEAGREYLENAYYYRQTEPDRESLRRFGGV